MFGFQAVALGQCRQHGGAVDEGHVVVGAVDGNDKTGQRRRTAAVVGEQVLWVFGRCFAFLVLGVLLQAGAELRQFALQVGAFDKGLGKFHGCCSFLFKWVFQSYWHTLEILNIAGYQFEFMRYCGCCNIGIINWSFVWYV